MANTVLKRTLPCDVYLVGTQMTLHKRTPVLAAQAQLLASCLIGCDIEARWELQKVVVISPSDRAGSGAERCESGTKKLDLRSFLRAIAVAIEIRRILDRYLQY